MFTTAVTRIAASAVAALVMGGSGTAAIVAGSSGASAEAGASLSAEANADLSAAQDAHDQATAALASSSAEGKAKAEALIDTSTAKLENASVQMRAAVDAGSKTAIDGIADFTRKSTELVNRVAATSSAAANASVQAGGRLSTAVGHQVAAARSVGTAKGQAALKSLSETKVATPPPPPVPANASASASASSNTTASAPPANVVSSTTGQLGINLGR